MYDFECLVGGCPESPLHCLDCVEKHLRVHPSAELAETLMTVTLGVVRLFCYLQDHPEIYSEVEVGLLLSALSGEEWDGGSEQ